MLAMWGASQAETVFHPVSAQSRMPTTEHRPYVSGGAAIRTELPGAVGTAVEATERRAKLATDCEPADSGTRD